MMRTAFFAAIAMASVAVVKPAQAETPGSGFGAPGQFIVSVDRLFGLQFWSIKTQPDATPMNANPNTTKLGGTSFSLLWNTDTTNAQAFAIPVYSTPQLGFDYVLGSPITLGASLGYVHHSASQDVTNNANGVTTSQDLPSGNALLLHPRVGYVFPLTPLFSIWARAGVTYYWFQTKGTSPNGMNTTSNSADGLGLSVDPQLVITPVPHVGITVGPMLDFPIAGSSKNQSTNNTTGVSVTTEGSAKLTSFGIMAGVLAHF